MRTPEERIRTASGVSKRLFVALSDLRGQPPQLEDALFQMASVIDATSKYHFPNEESSKARFSRYLDSITTDLFRIASLGRLTLVDCTFEDREGVGRTFGEVVYGIRCSSYHDPNEVDSLIHWGEENQFGVHHDGKFIVNQPLLTALFLMLLTDEANRDRIDIALFTDDHYITIKGDNYPFNKFLGNRKDLLATLLP